MVDRPCPCAFFSFSITAALGRLTVVGALLATEEDEGRCEDDDALRGVMDWVFLLLPKNGIILFFFARLAGRGGSGG